MPRTAGPYLAATAAVGYSIVGGEEKMDCTRRRPPQGGYSRVGEGGGAVAQLLTGGGGDQAAAGNIHHEAELPHLGKELGGPLAAWVWQLMERLEALVLI